MRNGYIGNIVTVTALVCLWSTPALPQSTDGGKWSGGATERSLIDDSQTVAFSLPAETDFAGWLERHRATLIIRCQENKTAAYIATGTAASVERGDRHTVQVRFDSRDATTQGWGESTDDDALFAPDPVPLIREIVGADRMIFRFTPFKANPATLEFDVRGLDQHIGLIASECNWPRELDSVDMITLIGLNQKTLRKEFVKPASTEDEVWIYDTTQGQVAVHFEGVGAVGSAETVLAWVVGPDFEHGEPPRSMSYVDPRTLLGLTSEQVLEKVGTPLVELDNTQFARAVGPPSQTVLDTWIYDSADGKIVLYFEGSRQDGSPGRGAVSWVLAHDFAVPDRLFPGPSESLDSIDPRTLVGLDKGQLEDSFGSPLYDEGGRWQYRSRNGLVTVTFLDTATRQIVASVRTPRLDFP